MIDQKLQAQLAHAYAASPAMRAWLDEAGVTPEGVRESADWHRIPVFSKDRAIQLQQAAPPFGGLLAVPLDQVRHIFFSPGPLYEVEAEGDDDTQVRMACEALRRSGFGPGDVVLNTLSYHLVPAGLLLDMALVQVGCTVVPGGVGNSELQLKMIADLGVTGYVGTPGFLAQLLDKSADNPPTIAHGGPLRKTFFTGEPLFAPLRARFVGEHGLSVGNGYATAELGFLALDTEGNLALQLLPEPLIEIVDSDTGQPVGPGEAGEVVVTSFSRAWPLIRYGTGDMAVNFDPAPGQSRQEQRAIALVGRCGEAVKVRGMFVHPNQVRFAVMRATPFQALQGVVTQEGNRDHFLLRIAGGNPESAELVQTLVQQLVRVRVDAVEFVESLPAGAPGMVDARRYATQ
jgi:phenylacetate-CoA ligase